MTLVFGVAGRRVEVGNAARFPVQNVDLVYGRIHSHFEASKPTSVVASAACGADLLALKACCELHIRYRIVLPFSPTIFRATSVTDRPGDWGRLFDEFTFDAAARNDLVLLHLSEGDPTAYQMANQAILGNVLDLADKTEHSEAILVWDGRSYGDGDTTAAFGSIAKKMGIRTNQILTY